MEKYKEGDTFCIEDNINDNLILIKVFQLNTETNDPITLMIDYVLRSTISNEVHDVGFRLDNLIRKKILLTEKQIDFRPYEDYPD